MTENRKYEFTGLTREIDGHTLHQIRALRNLTNGVEVGDLGGFIENESNLSHDGECWVGNDDIYAEASMVFENGRVEGDAYIHESSIVRGNAIARDRAILCEGATLRDNAEVFDDAEIITVTLSGNAKVGGKTCVDASLVEFGAEPEFIPFAGGFASIDWS